MTQVASISLNGDRGKKPSMAVTSADDDSLLLNLVIDDPEVVTDLKKRDEGRPRNSFAVSALRIGILALRQAQGSVDAEALKHEGQHLISSLSHELQLRVADIDRNMASVLKHLGPSRQRRNHRPGHVDQEDGVTRQPLTVGDCTEHGLLQLRLPLRRIPRSGQEAKRKHALRLHRTQSRNDQILADARILHVAKVAEQRQRPKLALCEQSLPVLSLVPA